ncbi:MAG TPA: hypothetical protein VL137_13645 [Polyangiaceae bacterium]|nr:hypothetical protein [Polyangiaceae bacterium]
MRGRTRRSRSFALFGGLFAAFVAANAAAQSEDDGPIDRRIFQRPHAVAQFDVGVLTLPGAPVCLRPGVCDRANPALLLSAWPLYRASKRLTVGAGLSITFAPASNVHDGSGAAERSHSSNYFLAESTARYLPIVGRIFEAWLGATAGLVVVNDSFKIAHTAPQQHYMGETGSSLATEGLTLGGALGAAWMLMPRLTLGGTVRGGGWWLPRHRATTALGDTASLGGNVPFIGGGLMLSYSPG